MKHIPNLLSVFRIILIPLFVREFLRGNTTAAIWLLVLSGLTDFLDGFLARRFRWITTLGKVLDPAADKLTLITLSIVLTIVLKEYRGFFFIWLGKDLFMMLVGAFFLKRNIKLEGAKWWGKIATASFYIGIVAIGLFPQIPHYWKMGILLVITVLELIAMFSYFPEARKYLKEAKE